MPADTAPAWPDPERPGVPLNPERDGWHWLLFRDGSRVCSWWNASACGWASSDTPGYGADYLPEEAEQDHVTCEPCLTPSEVTAREAAAWAAGAAAMREMAEASADCGCDVRAIVLERLASHGLREAERCCGQHYDACCALTAAAIRALPIPPEVADVLVKVRGEQQCEAEAERDEFFNRLGRITSELGLPMDCTASRIIEAIYEKVDDEREACASVSVKVDVPEGAESWSPLEAWEEALLAFDEAFRTAIRALPLPPMPPARGGSDAE